MGIKKLMSRLDDFFDLSKKKQTKKFEKLAKIISSLKEKKSELKADIKSESKQGKNSKEIYNLCKEFKVLTKMLKKAKKQQAIIIEKNSTDSE